MAPDTRCLSTTVAVAVLLVASAVHANRAWTAWHTLATLELDNGESVGLEWRASFHNNWEENVRAQWRVTNRTSQTLRDVTVGTRTYVCAGGRTRTVPAPARLLGKTSEVRPGKRRATQPDHFTKDSCQIIYRVVFPEASQLVHFRLGDSTWKGWGDFGRVVVPAGRRTEKPPKPTADN